MRNDIENLSMKSSRDVEKEEQKAKSDDGEEKQQQQQQDSYANKYGPAKCKWIDAPESAKRGNLFIKPYALNYFHDGVLYRTQESRGSTIFEMFFDLLYVGIVANLAQGCISESNGISLARDILLFLPCWQIWGDMRDFMDYYYNNDMIQKTYVLWIMFLMVTYANNAATVVQNDKALTGLVVACYMLARFSFATIVLVYNVFFVKEHRKQMLWYCAFVYGSVIMAGFVILPTRMYQKIIIVCCLYFWDNLSYSISFSAWFKKLIRAEFYAAMNIEHEIQRHNSFVTIAIGEFLYPIVAYAPASGGLNETTARCTCVLVIAYCLTWFYFAGEGSRKAIHAIRRHSITGLCWIQFHLPLIISLQLAANGAGVLTTSKVDHPNSITDPSALGMPRKNYLQDVQIYFGAGLAVSLTVLTCLALLDKGLDDKRFWIITPPMRILPRILWGLAIFGMSFAKMKITLYMGLSALFLTIQLIFENIVEAKSFSRNKEEEQNNQASKGRPEDEQDKDLLAKQQGNKAQEFENEESDYKDSEKSF
ncbi:hypothetical protein AWRI3579_g4660 [Hanseniaspora osmophila]|uniref:Low temperature requirement protein A n=1 Tax=Hanseniaspora osmophila TaxID=56408 RepID=A0A1E5R004_9ASCO|nr:hypothetical protein AWRI3579_g4660 [Hanseniaspora osmophila]